MRRTGQHAVDRAKQRAEGIRQTERELAAATARRDSITAQLSNVRMLGTLGGPRQAFIDPTNRAPRRIEQQQEAEQATAQTRRSGRRAGNRRSSR